MKNDFLALFGHIVMDITMRVDMLPTSGTVAVNKMEQNFGGTAGNFGMVASKLGYPFHLYSSVSEKTHSEYLKFLERIGVDLSHVVVDKDDMGPVGYAVSTGEEQIFYFYQGPMETSLFDRLKVNSLDYEYVHFGTGLPSDYLKFSQYTTGSKVVFDPGQEISYRYNRENLEPLLELAYLTIMNSAEYEKASAILGISPEEFNSRCRNLVVTKGKDGSELHRNGETLKFPSFLVENPYDTIGAGDAYRAGFYFGLNQGMTLEDSLVMATVTSSVAIRKPFRDFDMDGDKISTLYRENREMLLPK